MVFQGPQRSTKLYQRGKIWQDCGGGGEEMTYQDGQWLISQTRHSASNKLEYCICQPSPPVENDWESVIFLIKLKHPLEKGEHPTQNELNPDLTVPTIIPPNKATFHPIQQFHLQSASPNEALELSRDLLWAHVAQAATQMFFYQQPGNCLWVFLKSNLWSGV